MSRMRDPLSAAGREAETAGNTGDHAEHGRRPVSRPDHLLTVGEAARYVGCCDETIRRAYLARQLVIVRFGRRVRVRLAALDAWLERGGKTTTA